MSEPDYKLTKEQLQEARQLAILQDYPYVAAIADEVLKLRVLVQDYEAILREKEKLVKELDVLINGADAAESPILIDVICDIRRQIQDGRIILSRSN